MSRIKEFYHEEICEGFQEELELQRDMEQAQEKLETQKDLEYAE